MPGGAGCTPSPRRRRSSSPFLALALTLCRRCTGSSSSVCKLIEVIETLLPHSRRVPGASAAIPNPARSDLLRSSPRLAISRRRASAITACRTPLIDAPLALPMFFRSASGWLEVAQTRSVPKRRLSELRCASKPLGISRAIRNSAAIRRAPQASRTSGASPVINRPLSRIALRARPSGDSRGGAEAAAFRNPGGSSVGAPEVNSVNIVIAAIPSASA